MTSCSGTSSAICGPEADEKGDSDLTLDQVATDLTQMATDGLLDPVVGREEEMERIIQILLRKRKSRSPVRPHRSVKKMPSLDFNGILT